jgi:hypothetical protein
MCETVLKILGTPKVGNLPWRHQNSVTNLEVLNQASIAGNPSVPWSCNELKGKLGAARSGHSDSTKNLLPEGLDLRRTPLAILAKDFDSLPNRILKASEGPICPKPSLTREAVVSGVCWDAFDTTSPKTSTWR